MEPKRSYRAFREDVPEAEEVFEIGKADVVRDGTDLTLIAWGAMMRPVLEAAEAVQTRRGATIEIIDLLTLAPMDDETIVRSVKKTGRCVIVQEAAKTLGVASEVIAVINDKALMHLEAPVRRVTGYDVSPSYFARENAYIPGPGRIARAIEETLDF
jgi:pyruvate dehydrogenase E1 component beta subunit